MTNDEAPEEVVVLLERGGTVSQRLVDALEGVARALAEEPDVEAYGTSGPALQIGMERPRFSAPKGGAGIFCIGYDAVAETCTLRMP